MPLIAAQIDAYLDTLYASLGVGAAEIVYQGRSIKYSTPEQIQTAIKFFELRKTALATVTTAATTWPAHRRLVRFASGLASSDSPY
jgi:hypothetical protein